MALKRFSKIVSVDGARKDRGKIDPRKTGGGAPKTLDRVLSKAGLGSRTDARKWVGGGRVRVNGKLVQTPDHWVDLEHDRVTLDGKPVCEREKEYLLLYKPTGYITTYKDPEGRPTVYDLFGDDREWMFPVGRLDLDTSGLLLMTNDSQFAERITNPVFKVPKTYLVKTADLLTNEQIDMLKMGILLNDGPTRPAEVRRLRDRGKRTFIEMTIREGRNRQVRRMIDAIGSKVLKLVRIRIGEIEIGNLEIGRYRELRPAEIHVLLQYTKCKP